jgi:hypothetical protein
VGGPAVPTLKDLRCPTCAGRLAVAPSVDPLTVCLSCAADHRFFVMPEFDTQTRRGAITERFPELEGTPVEAVVTFWLTDARVRPALNEQLAELLRTVVDGRRLKDSPPFSRCAICGEPLTLHEQPDIWVVGLQCKNTHRWASRGGLLFGRVGDARLTLHAELSEDAATQLIRGWLNDRRDLKPQLHKSLRRVLESWPPLRESAS